MADLGAREVRPTVGAHSSAVVVPQIGCPFAEDASRFEFAKNDAAVLNSDGEFVTLVDVEQSSCFGRDDDASEVIDLSDDESVQGRSSVSDRSGGSDDSMVPTNPFDGTGILSKHR